jgi:Nucleotidyltransferase domain
VSATDAALEALAAANRPEQFTIMEQAMRLLADSPAVTHLAVRGSFAAGTSDRLSDVDLVVGIREPDYPMFTTAHDALIAVRLGQLPPAWPDTIVPDLGCR